MTNNSKDCADRHCDCCVRDMYKTYEYDMHALLTADLMQIVSNSENIRLNNGFPAKVAV